MGLQINTNVAALNAYRNLSGTQGQMSTSLERLSSGLRINRAADDAAGLAISEKLRGQISGLNQASSNAQDGISLIQTAEGALNASTSILQRMRQLSVQSSNDSNTDADRGQIQKEVDQLSQELTRIGASSQFNGKNLLNGALATTPLTLQIGANAGQSLSVSLGDMRGYALGAAGEAKVAVTGTVTTAPTNDKIADGTYTVNTAGTGLLDSSGAAVVGASIAGGTLTVNTGAGVDSTYAFGALTANDKVTLGAVGTTATATLGVANTGLQAGDYTLGAFTAGVAKVFDASNTQIGNFTSATGVVTDLAATTVATFGAFTGAGALTKFSVGGTDVSTQAAATAAMGTVDAALTKVTDQRSTLGAVQNRLQYTIANLGVAAENLTASESRIRDTDMAKEMTSFTRAQILSQAGISMLAQANQAPQSVLKLLG